MKTITINYQEIQSKEGIYLVDPKWVHLDERELKGAMNKNHKIFKVNFGE